MSVFDLFKKLDAERTAAKPVSFVVCCLGNPGREYERTRHNMGWRVCDELVRRTGASLTALKFEGVYGFAELAGKRGIIIKPQTFMNESGRCARAALDFYKLPPSALIAVSDDLELRPGRIRVRPKGSDGGQKGIRSIIACLGTDEFPRVRVGTGRPAQPDYEVVDWVLGKPSPEDEAAIAEAVLRAADAVEEIIKTSPESAMNKYNGK